MKRTLIIVASVALIIFLIVRMIVLQSNRQDEARRVFVSQLNYDFRTVVDSVSLFAPQAPVGLIYFKLADSTLGSTERKISRRLDKKNGYRLLVRRGSSYEMFSKDARDFQAGDSLYINSADNRLRLYREQKLVGDFAISEVLRH
jgi:hypothetical protein